MSDPGRVSCVGEPISWLRLERLRLGELAAEERRAVEAHLGACPACAACLAEADRPLALPPLRSLAAGSPPRRIRIGRALFAAAPAVALLLALALRARPHTPPGPARLVASKGGGVVLQLASERAGVADDEAAPFLPGDRWKALVTCPAGRLVFWDLIVVDGGGRTFPLAPSGPIACGNHVPLPGAFRLEGTGSVAVCAIVADNPVDRGRLGALDPSAPPDGAACSSLRLAGPRAR